MIIYMWTAKRTADIEQTVGTGREIGIFGINDEI